MQPELSQDDRVLLDELPTPLARALVEVMKPVSPSTNDDVRKATDVLLRFLALACYADYLHAPGWHDPTLNDRFAKLCDKAPALGGWQEFLQHFLNSARRHGHGPFLRELPDTWARVEEAKPIRSEEIVYDLYGNPDPRVKKLGRIEWLIYRRNALAHDRIDTRDAALTEENRRHCVDVFRDYRFLRRYELWIGTSARAFRLKGLSPEPTAVSPSLLGGEGGAMLTRDPGPERPAHEQLPLPPLMLDCASLDRTPGAGEIVLYHGVVGGKAYYVVPGPPMISWDSVERARHIRSLRERKEFPQLGAAAFGGEELRRRIAAATERSFRVLADSHKYIPSCHVERAEYEPRLAPWIDSMVPLLGLCAEAGSGKTGILASLVHRWRATSPTPVLFLLANQFQDVADLDGIVQRALNLLPGTSTEAVAEALRDLVIVIDGLNEHPNHADLLERMCRIAHVNEGRSLGPRFALSWRAENAEWTAPMLAQATLWWTPEEPVYDPGAAASQEAYLLPESEDQQRQPGQSLIQQQAADGAGHDGTSDAISTAGEDAGDGAAQPARPGPGVAQAVTPKPSARPAERRTEPFVTVGLLTDGECAEVWERCCQDDRLGMRPRFGWRELSRANPMLVERLRRPLELKLFMKSRNGRLLQEGIGEIDVFSEYLDGIRGNYSRQRMADFLRVLGSLMLRQRRIRVSREELEQACPDLMLPAEGQSPLFALEHAGIVSTVDRRTYTFAVERIAQQVIGEYLADLPESETGDALAAFALELSRSQFGQADYIVQVALDLRMERLKKDRADDYLMDFIDGCGTETAGMAAAALEARVMQAGEEGAASIAALLLDRPTDSDLRVATLVAKRLDRRNLDSLAARFLSSFIEPDRIEGALRSEAHATLAVEFLGRWRDAFNASEADVPEPSDAAALAAVLDALRERARRSSRSGDLRLLGMGLVAASGIRGGGSSLGSRRELLEEAVKACHARVGAALEDIDDAREQLAAYLVRSGKAARGDGDRETARSLLAEALEHGGRITDPDLWSPCPALWELADLSEEAGDLEECIRLLHRCEKEEIRTRRWWAACVTASRLGDTLQALGRHDEGLRWQFDARRLAERDGSVRARALASLWIGLALRAAGRHEEALAEFLKSHEVGTQKPTPEDWNPAAPLSEAANALGSLGRWSEAVEWRHRAIAACEGTGNRRSLAIELEALGRTLSEVGRLEEAFEAYERSYDVGMSPERVEDWKPGIPLSGAARVLGMLERWDEAADYRRRAAEAFREDGNRRSFAIELDLLGDDLVEAGRPEEALDAYLKSHETGMNPERVEDWKPGIPLGGAARALGTLERWTEAADCRRRAADAFLADGDRRGAAVELEYWGHALEEAGRHEEALAAFLSSHETGMNPERVERWKPGIPLGGAARVLGMLERWTEAADYRRRAADAFREDGDRRGAAVELELLGDALVAASRHEEALDAYLKSHETGMNPERVERWKPGIPLSGAARVLGMLERWNEAADCRRRAADAFREDGDRRTCTVELEYWGHALEEAGRHEEALAAFLSSHETGMNPERVEDWKPGIPLGGAARVLGMLKRWDEAADYRRRAAEAFREDGNRRSFAIELEMLGHALREAGRLEEALDAYRRSHEAGMSPERVDDWSPGPSLSGAARTLGMLERWDEAIDCRHRAIEAFKADNDRRSHAVQLELLGDTLRDAGRLEESLEASIAAYEAGMSPERVEDWSPGVPLGDAARTLGMLKRWDEAADCRRRAIEAFEAAGNRRGTAVELDLLGDALVKAGCLEEALDAYLKSHETGMNPERVERWKPGIPLGGAARVLGTLERWDEAVDYRRRAAEAFREDGNRRGTAIELEHLGHALREANRLEEALGAYLESHETGMNPERVERWKPGIPLGGAARALGMLGRWNEAADHRRRAADAFLADGDRRGAAVELELLGDALVEAGRHEEALDAYLKSHETGMTPEPSEDWDSARPLLEAARTLERLGRTDDAIRTWQAAVEDGLLGRAHAGDGDGESTLVSASVGLGRMLAARDGNIAALEAMEAGREAALLIERLERPEAWDLQPCAAWWDLQSTLLAAIGDRAESEAAARRAAALFARLGEPDDA